MECPGVTKDFLSSRLDITPQPGVATPSYGSAALRTRHWEQQFSPKRTSRIEIAPGTGEEVKERQPCDDDSSLRASGCV
jgi:hypothetical protein